MTNKQKVQAVLKELDDEIAALEKKRAETEKKRKEAWDFSDKNWYASYEESCKKSMNLLQKAKGIVTKHLGS